MSDNSRLLSAIRRMAWHLAKGEFLSMSETAYGGVENTRVMMTDEEKLRKLQYLMGNKAILEIALNGAVKPWHIPAFKECLSKVNNEIIDLQMQLTFSKMERKEKFD